jgi:hypothetical protein
MASAEAGMRAGALSGKPARLAPGQSIDGPALVESAMTTILLRPRERAVTTPPGWLNIVVRNAAEPQITASS